jgi:hypothetical protein
MWQTRLPPKKVVEHWFRDDDNNIGVICGGKKNLSIIDFDDIDSYYDWRKTMIKRDDCWRRVATSSYRVRTSRGMHVYLNTKNPEPSRKYPETKIDIRCSGNYTLVPPSIHPTGTPYEALGRISDIAMVDSMYSVFPFATIPQVEPGGIILRDLDIFEQGAQNHTIIDIKSRVNILQFVGQFTRLRKGSVDGRWWWGRCINPGHADRNPSMRIDAVNGRVKCMSSGCKLYHDIGYDIIDVYCLLHNTDVKQAVKELSEAYFS